MSVIPYPGFLYVDTLCALSGADVTELNTGCLAFVESEDAYFRLAVMDPPPVPNGTDVISVPGGPPTPGCTPSVFDGDTRRWILTNIADAVGETANSLAWYIDAVLGDNANTGTDAAHPVQTFREVGERWERGAGYNAGHVDPALNGPVRVHILSDHLLDTDTILVKRPLANDNPIIVTYENPAAPLPVSVTVTTALDIDHLNNQVTAIGSIGISAYLGQYIVITTGVLEGYWAYIYEAVDPDNVLTTPFVKQLSATSPTLDVATTVAVNVPIGLPVIRAAGCRIPSTIVLDVDPGSEIWFYDVSVHDLTQPAGPVPFVQPGLFSGVLRFFRSEGDPFAAASFVAGPLAGIAFSGSSTANMNLLTLGTTPGVTCSGSYVALTGSSNQSLTVDKDSVFSPTAKVDIRPGQSLLIIDAAVNNATIAAIEVIEGSVHFAGAFYGTGNAVAILNMRRYAKGSYVAGIANQLTVADLTNVPYTATINFQHSVVKNFVSAPPIAANIPFVSNATASDSQAGLIASP